MDPDERSDDSRIEEYRDILDNFFDYLINKLLTINEELFKAKARINKLQERIDILEMNKFKEGR